MRFIIPAVLSIGLFSAAALAQTTHPAPATPAPAATAAPVATATPAPRPAARSTRTLEELPSFDAGLEPGAKPTDVRHVACARVELTWAVAAANAWMPSASVVTVENRGGTTGLRLFTSNGAVTAVQTFEEGPGDVHRVTTLPGTPRIDWIDCQDGEPALGGIVVETYEARALRD